MTMIKLIYNLIQLEVAKQDTINDDSNLLLLWKVLKSKACHDDIKFKTTLKI